MFIYGNFCHVASNDRWQNQSSIFLYKTIDTLQQMTTAGYFNRAKLDLHIGDIIFATVETIQETTTYDTYVFRVLTVNEPITVEQISLGEVQAAAITTDTTLTGTGTADSPLGIAQSVKDSIDGKLPLAGGTMSGDINIGNNSLKMAGDVDILGNGNIGGIWVQHGGPGGSVIILNAQDHKIGNVEKLNNGADITIPTTGGTMALLSDIPSAVVASNVFTEDLGNNIVRISGTESFGVLAQQGTTERPITLPVTLADANYVVQTTATSANGICEIVSGFSARTTTGFTIGVRNLATATEATDVAVCWSIIGQKA